MDEQRPAPSPTLSGAELQRWYWLKEELLVLARQLGVPRGGGKQELTARLAAALDGRSLPPPTPRARTSGAPLPEPLTPDTVLPPGQRCTQQLRAWFREQVGPGFRFDEPMRTVVAAGCTLGEALEHWHATRERPPADIGEQFELNRFLRRWRSEHPGRSHREALTAWAAHRARPRPAAPDRGVQPPERLPPGPSAAVTSGACRDPSSPSSAPPRS
ncbi:hypothetical protein CLV92_104270 [Kineococcus xinjiangensis]|uniref:DUF6434 domain-containing protein n=1 Tax=Kineococcus xinjiangensis TaxID=512762 RepID=A0A2S6IT82_9ACTN|nr:DUF6434 domain-containing protein [Kineococcus xinjiangensis]PPK97449.1 hypothetical protein CLV92_104270 [Kineococcus xinjiangensis]